jgi:hypothetical protein
MGVVAVLVMGLVFLVILCLDFIRMLQYVDSRMRERKERKGALKEQ